LDGFSIGFGDALGENFWSERLQPRGKPFTGGPKQLNDFGLGAWLRFVSLTRFEQRHEIKALHCGDSLAVGLFPKTRTDSNVSQHSCNGIHIRSSYEVVF